MPWLTGSAQWVFKDFTTPLRVENPVPRVNQKGVIDRDMTRRRRYFVFQSYWTMHRWSTSTDILAIAGATKASKDGQGLFQLRDCRAFVNGSLAGVTHRNSQDFPAAGLRWMTPFVRGTNNLRVVATKGGTKVQDEITFLYQTQKWALRRTEISGDS